MTALVDTRAIRPANPNAEARSASGGLSNDTDNASERRVVTILFCDVAGSTAMAENLDPEEWADVMSEAFNHLIPPIERYGGTVTRLMGDAVLALFGAPRAHEDDPQRAIMAGLEIIESVGQLRERVRLQHGLEFDVRIGINTGLVVVGSFGTDDLVEYTAMGDAINVAARIEQMAEPGTILVGEATYRLAEEEFEFEPLGTSAVRGKREPEQTYRVIGRRAAGHNLTDESGREMPFTGRAGEMAMLREAIDELRFNGRGRIVTISGEAGIGKTRIVEELARYVRSLPDGDGGMSIALLENRVNPYDRSRPYASLQGRWRKVYGIEPDDTPQVMRQKVVAHATHFPPDFRERAANIIQRVMALDVDEDSPGSFERDDFKSDLAGMIVQLVRGWNPGGAFMFVGEDYHWADAASMELLSHLYELLDSQPILFLSTFRPDPDAPYMPILDAARERHARHMLEIDLQPLPSSDARELIEALVEDGSPEAEGLRQVILERADGNPLFVEEIVNALTEQCALERIADARWRPAGNASFLALSIPTSLQALLLERIDRLPPDARRTLQQAAVLGRTFARRVLQEIAQVNGALDSHLNILLQADLIRGADGECCENLTFRHALIQEAAYDTILHRHRREFHRRAAEAIEHLYDDRQNEYAGEIGYHYHQARDGRGVAWLMRGADQAQAVYEPATVIEYANKAIELAGAVSQETPTRIFQLRGHAHDMLGNYATARADLQTVLERARDEADRDREWEALIDLGLLWAEADYSRAGPLFQAALELARKLVDDRKIAHSLNRMGNWRINVGDPRSARDAHQEALDIFRRIDDPQGLAQTFDLLGLASYLTADFQTSEASFRQAVELFKERGDNRGLVSALAMLALNGGTFDSDTALPPPGDPDAWLAHAREAVDVARAIDWRAGEAFALIVTAAIYAAHGEPGEAIETARRALGLAGTIEHRQWRAGATHLLGVMALDLLDFDGALPLLSSALEMATELGSAYWTRSTTAYLAELHIATGRLDQAAELLDRAINADAALDSVGQRKLWYRVASLALARGNYSTALDVADRLLATASGLQAGDVVPALSLLRGQGLAGIGKLEAAAAELATAIEVATTARDSLLLWRLHLALASVYRAQGDDRRADAEAEAARAAVDQIAERLPDEPARRTFLTRVEKMLVQA